MHKKLSSNAAVCTSALGVLIGARESVPALIRLCLEHAQSQNKTTTVLKDTEKAMRKLKKTLWLQPGLANHFLITVFCAIVISDRN